ncbi:HGL106Cp [Eremothecium sinecaudum]|uniref:HGL106Cp n=1 Tax=Eremothecium sinecaudum TaxID=45286 RepID=A0A0X8HVG5_9SACH|nr:HGL106Cp [Eremothecium sinecaudum]AMD22234.1 HGL106Cp [Eremothecium sinecaudum]
MGLSIEQKYNICLMAEKHPRWTQLELARWAYEAYQLPKCPSQGTVSRLLAKKSVFMNTRGYEKDANRLRKPNNMLVRRILQEWISQSIWNGIPVMPPIIQDTAQSIWHRIPPEMREGNGSFSYKWISHLLSTMDISMDAELRKPPKVWTFEERSALKEFLSQLPADDLFTLDETFLAYNLPLCFDQYEKSDVRKRMEVVTVMLCANVTGSEKMMPLVVGKYENYINFRNYFPDEGSNYSAGNKRPASHSGYSSGTGDSTISAQRTMHSGSRLGEQMAKKFGLTYYSNRKSWLTSNLFHDWLSAWDKRLVADNRKIWIILDDSCSHRIINLHLKNIQLIFTSASSRFLPFNWGVLDEFKTGYRIQQYKALIDLQENLAKKNGGIKPLLSYEQSMLTMSNAFKFIKVAWEAIPTDTIKANWKSSGILPNNSIRLNESVSMAFKKNEALESKLNLLCQRYFCLKKWDYEMLLDLNIENKNTNFLSSEEIIESAIVDQWEPDDNELSFEGSDNQLDVTSQANELTDSQEPFHLDSFGSRSHPTVREEQLAESDSPLQTYTQNPENAMENTSTIDNSNDLISPRGATVSALIDKTDEIFVSAMQQQMITHQFFDDLFDLENPITATTATSGNTPSAKIVISRTPTHMSHKSHSDSQEENSPPFGTISHIDNSSLPHVHQGIASVQTGGTVSSAPPSTTVPGENIDLALPSPTVLSSDDLNVEDLHSYLNQLSTNTSASLNSERLVMLATLQTNVDIAKSMASILKHAEIREVGLSESALAEMKSSYNSCLKKIRKARQFLSVEDKRKRELRLETHLLNLPENKTQDIMQTSVSQLPVDGNLFFNTFPKHSSDISPSMMRDTSPS